MSGHTKMHDHVHQWIPHQEDALGFYEKREGGVTFACRGRVFSCASTPCDIYLFVPHDGSLSPSEATPVKSFARMVAA